jgi:hypothetical protein
MDIVAYQYYYFTTARPPHKNTFRTIRIGTTIIYLSVWLLKFFHNADKCRQYFTPIMLMTGLSVIHLTILFIYNFLRGHYAKSITFILMLCSWVIMCVLAFMFSLFYTKHGPCPREVVNMTFIFLIYQAFATMFGVSTVCVLAYKFNPHLETPAPPDRPASLEELDTLCTRRIPRRKRRGSYSDKSTNPPVPKSPPICAICIQPIYQGQRMTSLGCDHFFHETCIREWFEKSHKCPLCKQTLDNSKSFYGLSHSHPYNVSNSS